jgi:uncharacterized protein
MKTLRTKIQAESDKQKVPLHVIEKDYALSYVLAGIAIEPSLSRSLIFKGGTALKKMYFGDYRFSEDLDFTAKNAPKGKILEGALYDAMDISKKLLVNYGLFEVQFKRNPEKVPHPRGQDAFVIFVKFPWHHTPLCRIKVEITHDESVILLPEYKSILHGYEEKLDCRVGCYHIEEIIAEKLRALLQTHQKLAARGWNRPRARDYYDLWRILKDYSVVVDKKRLLETLNKKCEYRDVSYRSIDDFFTYELVKEASKHWQATLGVLVKGLPECQHVLDETKQLIAKMIELESPKF